ncbi:MAG: hypothetical protein PHC34_10075 [Candidatus Gastranaerophilales bacterium]|nr:hypothetical protein [Candidatus Gastranaerophilales bacterium]
MTIKELINNIIPYYNKYRQNKNDITGTEAVEILWFIGDFLKQYIEEKNVAPHALYRQIYGKSEGEQNVAQKSYITRDFLSRSYRVRNIFPENNDIKKYLPNLLKFRLFYQAMPFIDNPKYRFSGKEKENLYKLLNSNKSYAEIIKKIYRLQKEKIGIKNPRDQKLKEMAGDKEVFVKFYNYIYELFKNTDYQKVQDEISIMDIEFIKILSKNTSALALDGLLMSDFEIPEKLNEKWINFVALVKRLISKKDSLERRRFRRLIPSHRMTQLGEMIYLLTTENLYKTFR